MPMGGRIMSIMSQGRRNGSDHHRNYFVDDFLMNFITKSLFFCSSIETAAQQQEQQEHHVNDVAAAFQRRFHISVDDEHHNVSDRLFFVLSFLRFCGSMAHIITFLSSIFGRPERLHTSVEVFYCICMIMILSTEVQSRSVRAWCLGSNLCVIFS